MPDLETQWRRAERFGHHFGRGEATAEPSRDREEHTTGLPSRLRLGIERLSGIRMQDVRVHYNSSRPARVEAFAFAQGRDIHLAPGQEGHLPHEAWHVVQQKQRRVRPNLSLRGTAVSEDPALEREAGEMGRRAAQTPRPDQAAPWAAAQPLQADAAPGLAAGPAPVQRVRWKWSQTSQTWSPVGGSSSTSTPPTHQGRYDGEEFDDAYSQSTDLTVTPFLSKGESFMGESGARKQLQGVTPSDTEIRVPAKKTQNLEGGSGLHEVAPTNLRGEIAKTKNKVLVGLQSGFRTSTAHQMFRRTSQKGEKLPVGSKEVGTHTGFTPKGKGLSRTKGQGPAHDKLRKTVRSLKKQTDPHLALNELGLSHLESEPTGLEILESPYITGMKPNLKSIGVIGPPGKTPDPNRVQLAKKLHEERERTKRRHRSIKRKTKRGRSPSPPREPIDDQGKGGGYVTDDPIAYPLSPVPSFGDESDLFEFTANMSSWVSAPQREGFQLDLPPITTTPSTTPTTTLPPSTSTTTPKKKSRKRKKKSSGPPPRKKRRKR